MQKENGNKKVIPNLIWNLQRKVVSQRQRQRQAWKILNQVQDDNTNFTSGLPLTYHGNGFTLIELLVVVLIIGILAAVAVPQYQFAVDKTRVMTQFQNIQGMVKADQLYKIATGDYATDFESLDVDWTKTCQVVYGNTISGCPGNFSFQMSSAPEIWLRWCKAGVTVCSAADEDPHLILKISLTNGRVTACARIGSSRGQKICNYFTQQFGNSAQ